MQLFVGPPVGNCEICKSLEPLYDCPPEIAWPDQWLCAKCMRKCEKRAEAEEEERLFEQALARELDSDYPQDPEDW